MTISVCVSGRVLLAAYTGRAALVMLNEGLRRGVHIYQAKDFFSCPEHPEVEQHDASCRKCNGPLVRRPRYTLNRDSPLGSPRLLIIDECSMVGDTPAHKSQGSQWDHVVVSDERYRFGEPQRWLYTAVTRAKERVTIITGYG